MALLSHKSEKLHALSGVSLTGYCLLLIYVALNALNNERKFYHFSGTCLFRSDKQV